MRISKKLGILSLSAFLLVGLGLSLNQGVETKATTSPYSHTFSSGEIKTSAGTITLSTVDWSQSKSTYIGWSDTKGIQLGSSGSPIETFTLSTSVDSFTDATSITKVVVNASMGASGNASIQVNSETAKTVTTSAADYTFDSLSITDSLTITVSASSKAAYIKSIEVTYNSTVRELGSIEVTTQPTKVTYSVGEVFDPTGAVVKAHWDPNTVPDADISTKVAWPTDPLAAGTTTVQCSYTYKTVTKTATVNVTVNTRTITSIELTADPTVVSYVVGDAFSSTGMVVVANWSAGDPTEITDECTLDVAEGYVFVDTDAPTKTVTVSYKTFITTFDVTVTKYDYRTLMVAADDNGFVEEVATEANVVVKQNAVVGGISWDAIVTPDTDSIARLNRNEYAPTCLQFGSSDKIAASGVLRSQPFVAANGANGIKRIVLLAGGGAGGSAGNITVKVGDTALTCADNTFSGSALKEIVFTSENALVGRIEITFTNTSLAKSSSMKLREITILGSETLTTDAAKANDFAAKVELANTCGDNASLISEYDGLTTEVKALVDAITVYDFATSERTGGRTVSVTCGAKMTLIKALAATGTTNTNTSMSTNVAIIISVAVAILGLTSAGVILVLKRKKETF